MRNSFLILLLIIIISKVYSQDIIITKHQNNNDSCSYIKSYFTDTKDLIISPVKWNYKEWLGFAGFTGSSLIIIKNDKNIYNFFQNNRNSTLDNISKYGIEPWGSGIYSISAMGCFYLHGIIAKNKRSKKIALLGIKTYLISGLMVQIPKYIFNRHKPYHDIPPDPNLWEGLFYGKYYKSYFSGHTTTIFAIATVISSEYKNKPVVPFISYSIASAVGLSRINDEKHWASDVFGGAVFGYAIGKLIYNRNNWRMNLLPYSNGIYSGISMTIKID